MFIYVNDEIMSLHTRVNKITKSVYENFVTVKDAAVTLLSRKFSSSVSKSKTSDI